MYLTHFGPLEPTPVLVSQLKKSILAFRDIALTVQHHQTDRQTAIENALLHWLLGELGAKPNSEIANWLTTDAHLNAQGLEVWLKRMEKQP